MPTKRLSVVVITLNEEARLPDALQSVQWADEIVVLDSGSTDQTRAVAERFGARFHSRPDWQGYGVQKQRALELATCEWVLLLDADERVTPELRDSIERALATAEDVAGFEVRRMNSYLGRVIGPGGWSQDWVLRLVRRTKARITPDIIHEQFVLDGKTARLNGFLLHESFRDLTHHVEKLNAFTTAKAQQDFQAGRRSGAIAPLFRGVAMFFKQYVLRGGFLQGAEGLVHAYMAGVYALVRQAKLWELGRQRRSAERL